jgi:AraC family transcriptional regulator
VDGAVCRTLFDAPRIKLGALTCPPGCPDWGKVNVMGRLANVAFPRTGAVIIRAGRRPVVANANHVLVYHPHQEYRRSPVDERGWSCVFLAVDAATLAEAGGGRAADGPSGRHAYLLQHVVVERAACPSADPLEIEELLYHLLAAALADIASVPSELPSARRPRTRRAHLELVEHAKHVLTARLREGVSLDSLASEVHASPFHLARLFRAHTGYTLHGYLCELRVRHALGRVATCRGELTALAHELGYASLSHFSDSFLDAFGFRPSAAAQLRRIPEAGGRLPA